MITQVLLTIIILALIVMLFLERRDALNRLMARNLEDLHNNTQKDEPNQFPESQEDEDLIPLEDAMAEVEKDING